MKAVAAVCVQVQVQVLSINSDATRRSSPLVGTFTAFIGQACVKRLCARRAPPLGRVRVRLSERRDARLCCTMLGTPCQTNRCRIEAAMARGIDAPGGGGIVYWVITPEVRTDEVVSALRASWLKGANDDARYCVSAGMSESNDPSLHWLYGLNRSALVASGRQDLNKRLHKTQQATEATATETTSPAAADGMARSAGAAVARQAMQQHRKKKNEERTREITRIYNNFLRHKVFEIMRQMCHSLTTRTFEVAFMMDADTAVNRSNLERFVARIDPTQPVYTGLCKRRSSFSNAAQRGVGGGPGIVFSRPLLEKVCPSLEQCAPLRTMMDRLQFAGGDLMLAKCMEFLGHFCKMEKEIPFTRAAERYDQEHQLLRERQAELKSQRKRLTPQQLAELRGDSGGPMTQQRLDDLFRRGPPWVYPPLGSGTILVATRRSAGARALEQYERIRSGGLPSSSVISYHRVRPTGRTQSWKQDPRCRVFAEYMRLESGPAHWSSRCLPHFLLFGTPKSGTTSLFNWILQNPDLRAPVRKELHFWAPVLTPEKNCADRAECSSFAHGNGASSGAGGSANGNARWPLNKFTAGRMLASYLELFPRIDPREFAVTGEGSPAYLYSASAALFLENSLLSHIRLIVLLRDPTERAFSEYKNKRDLMVKGAPNAKAWVNNQARFGPFVAALRADTDGCTPVQLYAACEPCTRFASAPTEKGVRPTNVSSIDHNGSSTRCVTPPVVWQSWYHLFLRRFMKHAGRLLIEFSDDMSEDADAMMRRVGNYLGVPDFNYTTSIAYNTEKRRGAYIASRPNSAHPDGGQPSVSGKSSPSTAAVPRGGNEAKSTDIVRTRAAETDLAVLRNLFRHSVAQLDILLADDRWTAPLQQLRRTVPSAWRSRYGLPAAPSSVAH